MIDLRQTNDLKARIKVFGIGGAGGNALNNMIEQNLPGVEFYAANTDAQVLNCSLAPVKVQLGARLTNGLGAGGRPQVGQEAAKEDQGMLSEHMEDADMVFVTAGMGGGTGTGAAPVVAKLARDSGALTVGVVTRPFGFEGSRRRKNADEGLKELGQEVDSLIVIPNDRLLDIADSNMTMVDAFRVADQVLYNAVKSISDMIVTPGLINVDFADVRAIMAGCGLALMGTGSGSGEGRALTAAQMAVSSPLLEHADIDGAQGMLINITGGSSLTMREVQEAVSFIEESCDNDANIICGAVIDEALGDEVSITVVATGFEQMPDARGCRGGRQRGEAEQRREVMEALDKELPDAAIPRPSQADLELMTEPSRPAAATGAVGAAPPPPSAAGDNGAKATSETRCEPRIMNPFEETDRSEYDIPTYSRRRGR